MPVEDTFEYSARWDSVGLDCGYCIHFSGPNTWPDEDQISRCTLHGLSLALELNQRGYKQWEWFCKDFEDTGKAFSEAVAHFRSIRNELSPGILYRLYGKDDKLLEFPFEEIGNSSI